MFEPYRDMSPKQAILKAAQIGFSTLAILKTFWVAKNKGLNIIYTLPTQSDVWDFAGGKVNRIVAQNPVLQEWTEDKDSIEQKAVGQSLIYYRGTFTQKAAIMVSSDLNVYDEVDTSKPDVVEQYSTRLQHSKFKWEWYFSHPSAEGSGVDKFWKKSDQKHWFITCPHCKEEQYMDWPHSIDIEKGIFVCKYCEGELTNKDRRKGRWVAKYKDREFSGYWMPLLIAPWVTAKEIIGYKNEKSEEYFYNKVLGLPYVGGGNKLTKQACMNNLTSLIITPEKKERVVIGVDTGKEIHLVAGTEKGLFYYSSSEDYAELESLLIRWPRAVAVIDQGGDLIGPRKLREKYPGRVFLCTYSEDRKTKQLVRWGKNDEEGAVIADRNRMIQLVVDEFTEERIPLQGDENDWYDFWLHWNALTRVKEIDDKTGMVKRKIWVRSGDDHFAHATTYWRVGMSRFCGSGSVLKLKQDRSEKSFELGTDNKVPNPKTFLYAKRKRKDWRSLG